MHRDFFTISENKVSFSQPEISLPIGYAAISRQFFHREIPSPYEVEMAISTIEDHIQATPQLHHLPPEFNCSDDYLKLILHIAGEEHVITQSQLEQVFNRVADVISGSPKHEGEFPDDRNFISYLIIIRELSHHLNIKSVINA
ncbi:hypothetical protein [Citrobacter sp. JGM124]|uniref:hypothetical protein n=1 Tax=Citrobacter sp. JGM124 TaxID=2799789 RepID=UPI001BAA8682|nr:hypothetical protein [Citrobacter sp. JGM124]MBS0849407.1 hypothetical protein [Citrobacter sp. JGM124]